MDGLQIGREHTFGRVLRMGDRSEILPHPAHLRIQMAVGDFDFAAGAICVDAMRDQNGNA